MNSRLDSLIAALPPEGQPRREWWEETIAEEMWQERLERYAGLTPRAIMRVTVMPGREADARRWVEDVLGEPWPRKRVERELGRMIEPLYQGGEVPPEDVFDVRLEWRLRATRRETREYPAYTG